MSGGACPCGGGDYRDCCEPFISGARVPQTAEQLMRSRYSAYTLSDEAYLLQTWHRTTRPARLDLESQPAARWLGLKIVATREGKSADTHGVVEFIARYKVGGKAHRLHETSRFVREEGRWSYVDGKISPD